MPCSHPAGAGGCWLSATAIGLVYTGTQPLGASAPVSGHCCTGWVDHGFVVWPPHGQLSVARALGAATAAARARTAIARKAVVHLLVRDAIPTMTAMVDR